MHSVFDSPFIVPIACFVMVVGLSLISMLSNVYSERIRAEQRITMIAQGKSIEDVEKLLGTKAEETRAARDPLRSLANARRAGIVLLSSGIGLIVFFLILAAILHVREVLSGAAAGIIPVAIGIGFFVDYQLQKRELSRFGLEVNEESR